MKITQYGAGAEVELLPGGILLVRWRGVVTMASAEATKRAVAAWLPEQPRGIVSDYRGALVAMGDADMIRIMMGGQHDLPELPAAVIANQDASRPFFEAAVTAAWVGERWRYVCHDRSEALGWLRSHLRPGAVSRAGS